ncbi:MAG: FAD-binding oxidoreductase, partial [Chloroflexaceae bacterium]|nr:FAD-binding oxidoreductase [Chloroflexaceae bacterium]
MAQVAVIGGGVVGAAIAYELTRRSQVEVTLIEGQTPASGSSGAALGVLMAVISQKVRGRAWQLRETSLRRYQTLLPELAALTGQEIPANYQGLLRLRFPEEPLAPWEHLVTQRRTQGWPLEIWSREQLLARCPHLQGQNIAGGIYSPQDLQVQPKALTEALVTGARLQGATCQFGVRVAAIVPQAAGYVLETSAGTLKADWVAIAAGLGSTPLTAGLPQPTRLQPVLGQALQLKLPQPLGNPEFQPVISGHDVHLVPLGGGDYWLGATVEFPDDNGAIAAQEELLAQVWQQGREFCPELGEAAVINTWFGLRPRPVGEPAPITCSFVPIP